MKNIGKTLAFGLLLFSLYGCGNKKENPYQISVQDTLNSPIKLISTRDNNLGGFYSQQNKPLVVFYTMQACEPCKKIYPYFKKKAKKYGKFYSFGKEDELSDRFSNPLIKQHEIYSAPTVIIWKNGSIVTRLEGSRAIANNLEGELLEHSSN